RVRPVNLGDEIVEDDHRVPVPYEAVHDVRADEPSPSRHENTHRTPSSSGAGQVPVFRGALCHARQDRRQTIRTAGVNEYPVVLLDVLGRRGDESLVDVAVQAIAEIREESDEIVDL